MKSAIRILVGVPLAVLVTLSLFYVMAELIKQDVRLEEKRQALNINITAQIQETDISKARKEFVRPTLDNVPPPPPVVAEASFTPNIEGAKAALPKFDRNFSGKIDTTNFDRDAQPLVRIPPSYPARCQSRADPSENVRVRFDVTESGEVVNVEILDSSNACFNRAAIRVAEKWKYRPKVIEGKPQPRRGVETTFTFNLAAE